MESASVFWVGLDWGGESHTVHGFQPHGTQCFTFKVKHTPQGFEELRRRLGEAGEIAGVAVETTHGLVVQALLDTGLPVYPVNPKLSKAWRASCSVAEVKSDAGDARVLAEGLFHHHKRLHPLRLAGERARQLDELVRAEKRFIDQRTALVQELEDLLKRYHPQMLAFFDDWTSQTAWELLNAFPTPDALAGATKKRLCAFLRARHIGMRPLWLERIDGRTAALDWPRDKALEEVHALHAQTLAKMLLACEGQLDLYRKRVESLFEETEKAQLFSSLPGAGRKLAPRLCVIFADPQGHEDAAGEAERHEEKGPHRGKDTPLSVVRRLSGVAPVTMESGKKRGVCVRRACRKHWRDTMHLFAHFSKRKSAWAKAYYEMCRARGDSNASALRKLAYKWLAVIMRMCVDNKCYDESVHVKSLEKSKSPLYQYMLQKGYLTP